MKSYFYMIVPKFRCDTKMNDGSNELAIKSDNPYVLLFLRNILEVDTGIYMGHESWTIHCNTIIDVKELCDNYQFDVGQNGGVIFNDLMKQFRINMKLHWGVKIDNKIYKRAFNNAFSKHKGLLKKPQKDVIYNCLLEAVDVWVDNKKRFENLVIPVEM